MKYLVIFVLVKICSAANSGANSTGLVDFGLSKEERRLLVKIHAILMIIGWLFLVPTGFLFARLGRDLYKGKKLFGSPVWFQIHQISNYLAVGCICISMLCVFISQNFRWKGTGSDSKYWTEWHTDLGVISTVLAVIQPINSYFSWCHRIIGIVGYTLAFITTIIAAINFRKIWNEPLLEVVLVSGPTILSLSLIVISSVWKTEKSHDRNDSAANESLLTHSSSLVQRRQPLEPHVLRLPTIYLSIGLFLASALALSMLVVNGYKNV